MLYNKRADKGCIYGCCSEFGKHGGLSNRKHRQQSTGILRTREKRDYMGEIMEALLDSAPLPPPMEEYHYETFTFCMNARVDYPSSYCGDNIYRPVESDEWFVGGRFIETYYTSEGN